MVKKEMTKLPVDVEKVTMATSIIDLTNVPPLVGESMIAMLKKAANRMKHSAAPIYCVGPPGSGKTIFLQNMAVEHHKWMEDLEGRGVLKKLGIEQVPPAYLLQFSPETTKATAILGKLMINGTIMTVPGVIAQAAAQGAFFLGDEAPQGTQEVLGNLNSMAEFNANVSDGADIVYAKPTFRMTFAGNTSTAHAGNVPLPHAFASRMVTYKFDYPSFDAETEIAKSIFSFQAKRLPEPLPLKVPDAVIKYVVGRMRAIDNSYREFYPLSARNVARCIDILNSDMDARSIAAEMKKLEKKEILPLILKELNLSSKTDTETWMTNIYGMIHDGSKPKSIVDLDNDPDVTEFVRFMCAFGASEIEDCINSCFMVHLDIDASFHELDKVKNQITNMALTSKMKAKAKDKDKDDD